MQAPQASTLIIRAMALGEVTLKDWWRILRREIFSGLFLGIVLGMIGFFPRQFVEHVFKYLWSPLASDSDYDLFVLDRSGLMGDIFRSTATAYFEALRF